MIKTVEVGDKFYNELYHVPHIYEVVALKDNLSVLENRHNQKCFAGLNYNPDLGLFEAGEECKVLIPLTSFHQERYDKYWNESREFTTLVGAVLKYKNDYRDFVCTDINYTYIRSEGTIKVTVTAESKGEAVIDDLNKFKIK